MGGRCGAVLNRSLAPSVQDAEDFSVQTRWEIGGTEKQGTAVPCSQLQQPSLVRMNNEECDFCATGGLVFVLRPNQNFCFALHRKDPEIQAHTSCISSRTETIL